MQSHTSPVQVLKASGQGRFTGLAWSYLDTPDREGDVLLPSALEGAIEIHRKARTWPQVLVEHQAEIVVGAIDAMTLSERGLEVDGRLSMDLEIGRSAYAKMEGRQLGALSIGFRGESQKSGRTRIFTALDIREISLCRDPMNAGSRVETVKSWSDVDSQRDLERLLRDVAGMPNRLARKTALAAWPVIENQSSDRSELNAALSRLIGA